MTQCALAALAVAKGQIELAEAIYLLDEHLIGRLVAFDFDYFEGKGGVMP